MTKTGLIAVFGILYLLMHSHFAKASDCGDESQYHEVSKTELSQLIEKKQVFVVDVNSSSSFKEKHIPTAIHYGENKKNFAKMLPADKNALIVAYCGGVKCTAWESAAEAACKLGYKNVKHFKGGLSGWFAKS